MSTSKKKQQVRPVTRVKKINGTAQGETGRSRKTEGLVKIFANAAALPDPTSLPDGCLVFDKNDTQLLINIDGVWEQVD